MSSLLITTSRKPSQLSRRLCRWLAWMLNAECENRGKRSLPEMEEIASSKGRRRLLFVNEKQGNPSSLSFFEDEWLWPEVQLGTVKMPESRPKGRAPKSITFMAEDKTGELIAELFLLEKENEADAEIRTSKRSIEFYLKTKPVGLMLKVSGTRWGVENARAD